MNQSTRRIKSIRYRWGLTRDIRGVETLCGVVLRGTDIPADVLEVIVADGILDLGGTRGDPAIGSPVEDDDLVNETEAGATRIRVYNRGIHLVATDDEDLTRIARVCCMLQRFLPRPESPRAQAWLVG